MTLAGARALPARSVIPASGVQVRVPVAGGLPGCTSAVAGVPRTTRTVDPLSVIVEPGNVRSAPTTFLSVLIVPRGRRAVPAAFQSPTTSGLPLTICTDTGVSAPDHPLRIVAGAMGSEKVNVITSPFSGRPSTPPATSVVCTSRPRGAVLSTVRAARTSLAV